MISVIIPVYNTEEYLEKCVRSVLAQKEVEKEIILVDDGSTDNSPALCDRFSADFPDIIKTIHKRNEGLSIARNAGIEASTGEWIAFIDSDDDIESEMLIAYYDAISKYDSGDIVLTGYEYVDWEGSVLQRHGPDKTELWKRGDGYSTLLGSVSQNLSERAWIFYYVWNKLYKREIIKNNNIRFQPGVKYIEDFLFNAEYYLFVESIITVKGYYYRYWKHKSGTITSKFPGDDDFINRRTLCYETNTKLYKSLGIYEDQKEVLDEIEAQQILATAKWIFSDNCPLSFEDKVKHCNRIVNEYKYGDLIKRYPFGHASCVQKIQVKLLVQQRFSMFVLLGELLERIQKAKNLVKRLFRK